MKSNIKENNSSENSQYYSTTKMGHKTAQRILIFAFYIALCSGVPHQQFRKSLATEDVTQHVLGEEIVSAEMNIQPSSKNGDHEAIGSNKSLLTAFKEPNDVIGKSENDPVDFEPNEYIEEISDPVNPSEILNVNHKRASIKVPSNSPMTIASANPIYITIPIYVTKGDGQPLRLSVGGKEIPLAAKSDPNILNGDPLSPTSQYNRLLKENSEEPKQYKKSSRKSIGKKKRHHTTARKSSSKKKRSSLDSHKYKERQLYSYRFYF